MAQPLAPRRGARGSPGAAAAAAAAHCRSDKLPPADACAPQAFLVITRARGSDAGVWEAVPSRVCVCPAGSPASHRARPRPHWAGTMRSGCLHRVCQVRRARRGRARRGGDSQGRVRRGRARWSRGRRGGARRGGARRGSGTWRQTQLRECLAIKNNWEAAALRSGRNPAAESRGRVSLAEGRALHMAQAITGAAGRGGRQRRPGRDVRLA